MSNWILSKNKADALSNGIFLIALGLLFFFNAWWPGIILAIWALLAVRQYFTGRYYDLFLTTLILLVLFFSVLFRIDLNVLTPILFIIGGIYIVFREFFYGDDKNENKEA
ncbi:hypothetical protein [Criblamydia sequanensis]|uniref:Conserved putative membrane protein n=1 Tax=Candidatus Criblamydia sequanensis CRIB-18 TaxID=1437425 RepID=A0A090D1Y2_9BACT|nr:hypothetical protein [Criblamydia sequanensis]CDR33878.1 Conserved putative membrane protein [Criblamydia sequanensis CRIB-18]